MNNETTVFTSASPFASTVQSDPPYSSAPAPPNTGIIVPIYASYSPSQLAEVDEIIQVKNEYPSVPIIAVINQDYGPGHSYNANISMEVQQLEAAHVTVLGYVATVYGTRTVNSDEVDIYNFYNWYHVQGIFLDQMPNWEYTGPDGQWNYNGPGGIYIPQYFDNLTSYIESLGMNIIFANSGENVPENLIGTVDSVGIFENSSMPPFFGEQSLTGPGGSYLSFNKSDFIFFSYGINSIDPYYIAAASDYVGWLFVTNETLPQPYDGLPSYFPQLVSTIASTVSISVSSELSSGAHLSSGNASITVTQPDGTTSEGRTPFTFNLLAGTNVTITAENLTGYYFSRWSDGSTSQVRNVTVSQSTTLVAYYTTSDPYILP